MIRFAHLWPSQLRFKPERSLSQAMKTKILASVRDRGFYHPISVIYDGEYRVTWGNSRAWAAQQLKMEVPAIIFEQKPGALGREIADPRGFFDCPVLYKPHKGLIAPMDHYWTRRAA